VACGRAVAARRSPRQRQGKPTPCSVCRSPGRKFCCLDPAPLSISGPLARATDGPLEQIAGLSERLVRLYLFVELNQAVAVSVVGGPRRTLDLLGRAHRARYPRRLSLAPACAPIGCGQPGRPEEARGDLPRRLGTRAGPQAGRTQVSRPATSFRSPVDRRIWHSQPATAGRQTGASPAPKAITSNKHGSAYRHCLAEILGAAAPVTRIPGSAPPAARLASVCILSRSPLQSPLRQFGSPKRPCDPARPRRLDFERPTRRRSLASGAARATCPSLDTRTVAPETLASADAMRRRCALNLPARAIALRKAPCAFSDDAVGVADDDRDDVCRQTTSGRSVAVPSVPAGNRSKHCVGDRRPSPTCTS
jgi:hypothetical protein